MYLTPLIGGYLADQYLGSERAVKFGAILMALGYFTLCFGGETAKPYALVEGQRYEVSINKHAGVETRYVVDGAQRLAIKGNDGTVSLLAPDGAVARTVAPGGFQSEADRSPFFVTVMLLALCMVSVGNGFFKPNISTMVGELYKPGDRRRDTGFTIFYMGINLGSLGSQLLCPLLATTIGWWAGFGLAAFGMLFSWFLIHQFDGGRLNGYGEPPVTEDGKDRALGIYAAALIGVPIFYLLFTNLMNAPEPVAGAGIVGYVLALPLMGKLLFGTFLIGVPAILGWSWAKGSRTEFQMMLAAMILIVFNVVFWTLFEQAGSSLTLYADRNTDLSIFGLFSISAGQTQFFNAFFIVAFAPIMAAMDETRRGGEGAVDPGEVRPRADRRRAGLPVPRLGQAGCAGDDFKVAVWWLAGLYLIHSVAELCISPVGLSMITKLSIARIVGLMMGVWFLSISVAQYVAGVVAQVASVETVGGQVTNLKVSLDTYNDVFWTIGLVAAGIGGVLLLLSPLIRKWMHGVQ
ncbi:peptide MFS transporter [Sphingomonas sp. MMS24-JH45]